jgi:hypothetical protein
MTRLIRPTVCCALALFLTASLFAEDQVKAKKKKAAKPAVPAAFKLPKDVTLTAEQQAKLDELKTQYSGKLADAQKKVADVYTDEQRAAQKTARQDAMAAGKKGKELKAAVTAAVQLTDEQQQKLTIAEKDLKQLSKEVRKQLVGLLTDEQKQQLHSKKKS